MTQPEEEALELDIDVMILVQNGKLVIGLVTNGEQVLR